MIAEVLADAASNIGAARAQMAISLGWHIIIACLGVGMPLLILIADVVALRTGDAGLRALTKRWARVAALLFAVGAVSGTILSFEMGILWPVLMSRYGAVYGFPFALEGFAFFIEAIFMGIYLYGRDRLSQRIHTLTAVPIVIAGCASAFFVVTANAWMNDPSGFTLDGTSIRNPDPIAAMFNPTTPIETTHMILAAYMVTGFLVASVYAFAWLRGRRERHNRTAFIIAFVVAALVTPAQIVVGDMAARQVASTQPAKLAAMEALYTTQSGVAEHVGGVVFNNSLHGAIEIPDMLSFLLNGDPHSTVKGLDQFPEADWPNVAVVHTAFDIMVGSGFALLGLVVWIVVVRLRRRRLPEGKWFWRAAILAGPAATIAMECGWIVTEVGRQPWIVYGQLRTIDAVNTAPGLWVGVFILVAVYSGLTVATLALLRRIGRQPLTADH